MGFRWYVVYARPGMENRALAALEQRIKQMGMEKSFGQVLIPSAKVQENTKGRVRETTKKFYPGYIFVQMEPGEQAYHLVRNTPNISGFLGGKSPMPVSDKDIAHMQEQVATGSPKPVLRQSFEIGDQVRVVKGPFENLSGVVDEVKSDKQKLKVQVSIFGRAALVELEYEQVEKVA